MLAPPPLPRCLDAYLPPSPPMRCTGLQLRCLHALGKQRDLGHEDLRAVCGVESLTQLTHARADQVIRELRADRPQARRRRRAVPGVIRLVTDGQRAKLAELIVETGWPAHMQAGWLTNRHGIADVATGTYTTKTASEAIKQLIKAVRKKKVSRQPGSETRRAPQSPIPNLQSPIGGST